MTIHASKELQKAILHYQEGAQGAFDIIYDESVKYITKCVINVLNRTSPNASEDLLQDVIQETYLTIATKLDTLQNPEAFLQWAGSIATHHAQRTWNRDLRQHQMEQFEEDLDYELMDEDFIPEDILENKEKQQMIRKMLDELPTNQYLCVVEYFYNDLKETEVAAKLDMPLNTVKTNLARAKKKLKGIMENHEKKSGVKLYSMSGLLLIFLSEDVRAMLLDPLFLEETKEAVHKGMAAAAGAAGAAAAASTEAGTAVAAAGAAGETAAASAAATVGATATVGIGTKVVIGVAAAAVLTCSALGVGTEIIKEVTQASDVHSEVIQQSRTHEMVLVVSSRMGEKWDGEYIYRVEDPTTGDVIAEGNGCGEIPVELEEGQYSLTVEASLHRPFQRQLLVECGDRIYVDLFSDGSWLSEIDSDLLGYWLQYLDMPIGSQQTPAVFINDGSTENTSLILGTLENAMPCETRQPSILFYHEEDDRSVLDEGRRFAERYAKELFGYLPPEGIPDSALQISHPEEQTEFHSCLMYFEQLDEERIRTWVKIGRNHYLEIDGVQHSTDNSETYCIVATLRQSEDSTIGWCLESALCYRPDEEMPFVERGRFLEAEPQDEDAYAELTDQAVDIRQWEEKGIVTLTDEQRMRMENVLLCTAFADSGVIEQRYVANFGALLADVEVDTEPFLKQTDPSENMHNVLLMLAWDGIDVLNVRWENGDRCGGSSFLSYDLNVAESLMMGIFGKSDLSRLTCNIIMRGYNTEISDGRIYQPEDVYYRSGTLTVDKLERTGRDTICIYATYSGSKTLSCVYEAVENPDSYIGYTLTGVRYSYAG